jgi:hypothetical protein
MMDDSADAMVIGPWETPRLELLGDVASLTEAGVANTADGGIAS